MYVYECQLREMVACLLSFGASPNQQNALGQTPLHIAARVGCKGAAEQMLAAGANPAITDKSGEKQHFFLSFCPLVSWEHLNNKRVQR